MFGVLRHLFMFSVHVLFERNILGVDFWYVNDMNLAFMACEVGKLFADSGTIVTTAFISPYREDRDAVRALFKDSEFIEIYVNASLETCETRDPKGLYKKARAGEIKGFTGIDAPYEAPESGELELDSDSNGIEELASQVIAYLEAKGFLSV